MYGMMQADLQTDIEREAFINRGLEQSKKGEVQPHEQVMNSTRARFKMKKRTPADDVNEGFRLILAWLKLLVELNFSEEQVFITLVAKGRANVHFNIGGSGRDLLQKFVSLVSGNGQISRRDADLI